MASDASRASLEGTLFLDNNINKVVHEVATAASVKLTFASPIVISKKGSVGGPGGNPLISLQFLDGDGNLASQEANLGRCVKLR